MAIPWPMLKQSIPANCSHAYFKIITIIAKKYIVHYNETRTDLYTHETHEQLYLPVANERTTIVIHKSLSIVVYCNNETTIYTSTMRVYGCIL